MRKVKRANWVIVNLDVHSADFWKDVHKIMNGPRMSSAELSRIKKRNRGGR